MFSPKTMFFTKKNVFSPKICVAGSTSQREFLEHPNQQVRAVQLDVNPNGRKLDINLDKLNIGPIIPLFYVDLNASPSLYG